MAASSPNSVLELLELRQYCTQSLSDEIVRRIHTVRGLCKAAESVDGNGQVSWRRGVQNQGHHNKGPSSIPNKWRGSQPPPHRPNEKPVGRYVSKFTNSSSAVEDKILNQVILNKLNKFSAANYNEIVEFLEQVLNSDEKEFLHDFMSLVFKKASSEPTFCPLYARLIAELSVKYPFLKNDLADLYTKYMTIFEEVSEEECNGYEQFVQRNREKQHRLGYSQFLGELTIRGVLEIDQLKTLYFKIMDAIREQASKGETKQMLVEEYVDCLVRMTSAIQKGGTTKLIEIRNQLRSSCESTLEVILATRSTQFPGLTKKSSFAIMDCLDILRGS